MAKNAGQDYKISSIKEKVEIELINYNAKKIEKGEESEIEEALEELLANKTFDNIDVENNLGIIGENGITLKKENGTVIIGNIDKVKYKTEVTYEIVSIVNNKINLRLSMKNKAGIQQITCQDIVIGGENQTTLNIDYEVEQNKDYTFNIKLSNKDEDTFVLNVNANLIQIKENTSNSYPTITESGIILEKIVSIEYSDKDAKNYYSLDNGETWLEYEGNIKVSKEGTIKAKSIMSDGIIQIVSKSIKFNLASDAMPAAVYDGSYNNSFTLVGGQGSRRILVDSSMYGKKIWITATEVSDPSGAGWGCVLYAYLNNGTKNRIYRATSKSPSYTRKAVTIPNNVQYLIFEVQYNRGCKWTIKEIEVK